MRTRLLTIAALLLTTRMGYAQAPPSQPAQPTARSPFQGTVDFGGLFTTTDGDEARYERYRDTRDGVYSNLSVNRNTSSSVFNAHALHPGYRDQRYDATLLTKRVNVLFDWVSVPLNYSYIVSTPFATNGSTLTLDNNAQQAVQGPTNATNDGTAVGIPCAPGAPPAACGNATQVAQALTNRSIYNALASPFELRHVRDTANVGLNFAATRAIDVDANFRSSARDGQQPWGASFAFNTAVELPQPIDQRTNDLSVGASWSNPRGMFRLGWDGSWFNNNFQSLTWDNPIRISDFDNGLLPPNGPYDPNGYSNGNGPAQGRESVAPSNTMNVVSCLLYTSDAADE